MAEESQTFNGEIRVSSQKNPYTYVRLTKSLFSKPETGDSIHFSGLGNAMSIVVSVADILRNQGLCNITKISTDSVDVAEENQAAHPIAKIMITLTKTADFDKLVSQSEDQGEKADN